MSDIVLGALIGVGATAVGTIIIGIINYKQSKSQQRFDEQQSRIDRLVKVRERVLIPLMQVMSKWMEISKQSDQMIVRAQKADKEGDSQRAIREMGLMLDVWEKAKQVTSELAVLQGQVSDATLDKMIEDAKSAQREAGEEIMKFTHLVNNSKNVGMKTLKDATKEFYSLINNLRGYLLVVNKRIEELLTGDPST